MGLGLDTQRVPCSKKGASGPAHCRVKGEQPWQGTGPAAPLQCGSASEMSGGLSKQATAHKSLRPSREGIGLLFQVE